MTETSSPQAWVDGVTQGLAADGFAVSSNVSFGNHEFSAVAHRSRLELSKFGNCETFFVFADLPSSDAETLREFSSAAFEYAKESKRFPLPRGLMESVYCFAVGCVDGIDETTAASVRDTVPPKHWAAAEIPVVYDRSQGKLCFFEKTPMWGAAYYRGFRKQIGRYLDTER